MLSVGRAECHHFASCLFNTSRTDEVASDVLFICQSHGMSLHLTGYGDLTVFSSNDFFHGWKAGRRCSFGVGWRRRRRKLTSSTLTLRMSPILQLSLPNQFNGLSHVEFLIPLSFLRPAFQTPRTKVWQKRLPRIQQVRRDFTFGLKDGIFIHCVPRLVRFFFCVFVQTHDQRHIILVCKAYILLGRLWT